MTHTLPGTRALAVFEAAGRHLSFTRAAEEVGLTPAAVSYQIKEIEGQLGFALFRRTSRSMRLTPAGVVFLEATEEALHGLRRAAARARKRARDTVHLRISLGARFATHWLLPRLASFRVAHPEIELTFDISDAVRDFDTDDIDLAVRFGSGRYEGLRSLRLFDTVVAPVCSPRLLRRGPAIAVPADLCRHTLCHVDCRLDGLVWPDWPMWMAAAGVSGFDPGRCVAFTDTSHVVQAVAEGGGIGLVELAMVDADLSDGRLLRLFDLGLSLGPDYAYHLVWPEHPADGAPLAAFRDWLLGEVGASPG